MAWVAKFLHGMNPFLRDKASIRDAAIDQEEMPAGNEDPCHFGDKRRRIAEVMRRHAAGDQIEGLGGVGELLRLVEGGMDGDPLLGSELQNTVQHRRGQVGGCDIPSIFGQEDRGVSAAGRDVQRLPSISRSEIAEGLGNVGGVRKNVGVAVVAALAGKLVAGCLLRGIEAHRKTISGSLAESKENPDQAFLFIFFGMCVNPAWTNSSLS